MRQIVAGETCITYLIMLRPVSSNKAYIMKPTIVPGEESMTGWQIALEEAVPKYIFPFIKAIVCDGHPGLVEIARYNEWPIQRCHFHLISAIRNYVRTSSRSLNRPLGEAIMSNVYSILNNKLSDEELREKLLYLIALSNTHVKNSLLRSRIRGFTENVHDFLTYQYYPELNLPSTSNVAESLVSHIRSLLHKTRGFRSAKSFTRWVTACCLAKKTMVCNPKNQPNFHV
jgi:transposase-like protein